MADTYLAVRQQIPFATGRAMLSLFNGSGSGKIAKVYRIWIRNVQQTALTGVSALLSVSKIVSATGGNSAQINRMSTASPLAPAQIVAAEIMTVGLGDAIRRFPWSIDEPGTVSGTIDEVELNRPYVNVLDFNNNDTNIQPITLREGEGITVQCLSTISVTAFCSISFEFTLE
jgi:hypothetical protein